MQYHDWIEDEGEIERTEQRRATEHEHRFAPREHDLSQTTSEIQNELDGWSEKKTWCDLDEDCEK